MPFGGSGGWPCPEVMDVELATGQTLVVLALLILAMLAVIWLLAATRRSPR